MGDDDAFEELTAGIEMDDVPPSEEEARAYLGNDAFEKMVAFHEAHNNLNLLLTARLSEKYGAQANFNNALANLLRFAPPAVMVYALYRLIRR